MKLSLVFPHDLPRPDALTLVRAADRLGFTTVWTGESYGFDAITVATQAACVTERIGIGTSVVNVAARSPAMLAQSAASLDAISGGRLVLGIGTSSSAVNEGWHGVVFDRPLRRVREIVDIVRLVLRRERLHYDGECYRLHSGFRLIDPPLRPEIPIYLGSVTPAGAALAGEIGDGWLLTHVVLDGLDDVVLPMLSPGLERAGRQPDALAVCCYQVPVIVTDDVAAGRDAARDRLALYIGGMGTRTRNVYTELYRAYGFVEEAQEIRERFLAGDRDGARAAVSDVLVDAAAVVGDLDACVERLRRFDRPGVDEVAVNLNVPGAGAPERVAALERLAGALLVESR